MAKKSKEAKVEASEGLKAAVASIHKKFGPESLQFLVSGARKDVQIIPTGSMAIDEAIGIGGIPRGRIIEIFGPESSGKSTICTHVVSEAQKLGMVCAYIDAEHAFDPTYAEAIGVDCDKLLISQPDFGEQGIEIAESLAGSGEVGLIIVDSVAALTPKAELDGEMVDEDGKPVHTMGLQARMMSQAMRRLVAVTARNNCAMIFVNQLRQKIGVVYGNPETTPGGNALKFYASVRLDIRRTSTIKDGTEAVASATRVKVVKNKLAPPFREAEFEIRYGEGIDQASELLDRAVEAEILTCGGGRYKLDDKQVAHGREAAREWAKTEGKAILTEKLNGL